MKGVILTYLLTYGGAAASLFKPYYGLLIYVFFSIIKPEDLWGLPAGNYSRIIAFALLAGWGLRGFGDWRLGRAGTIVALLLFFWAWQILASLQAAHPEICWVWVESFSKVVLPFVVGITLIDSPAKLRQLAWVIVIGHAYVALDLNMFYYSGYNRLQDVGFGGMDNNCMAITLVSCTGLAFFLGFSARHWSQMGIALVCSVLMIHCVFFSFSRGGMLGLIITGLISFVLIPKKPRHYLIFTLMVLLALRLAGPKVIERFESTFNDKATRDASAQGRIDMWGKCVELMVQNPLFGIGPDHFAYNARLYGYKDGKLAHTLWLQVGAETGVVGLGLLLSFYGLCLYRLWPMRRDTYPVADPWYHDTARMVIASITGFAISAQFVSLPGLESPYYIVLLGAGALKLTSSANATMAAYLPPALTRSPALATAGQFHV